ncbi:kinase D-interacting substrate of 220 kDa-like [Pecten maximus]|uniref:kinase D-interacting substrate of 220 kDa-like n=1 Tax=Pecten maximus TaxID=6579 RepID=UPI0014587A93|nr:kinase D-interacting substrate of 220 kDa-like [Pecten maximus]
MASVLSAVTSDNIRILKALVKVPQSVNHHDLELGFLQAAKLGHTNCLECIIATNIVDIETKDGSENTALYLAVQKNKPEALQQLISAKADVNTIGGSNNRPIHVAAQHGLEECMIILINNGAKVNTKNSSGNTPLILGSRKNHHTIMQLLIAAGCDVNIQNKEGCSALHYSSHKAMGVDMLLRAGANPNLTDKENITPLLMAATEGFDNVVKALCKANCDVNIANASVKKTALHILAYKGHSECINDLVIAGGDVNMYDKHKRTPLWYAIKNKRIEVVRLLLKANSLADSFQCASFVDAECCPTFLALTLGLFPVLKLFIMTGYDRHHLKSYLQHQDIKEMFEDWKDIEDWLDHAQDSTMTLKQICRKWIRHHLGLQFYHGLSELPIPSSMKDYVFMKELDEEHI